MRLANDIAGLSTQSRQLRSEVTPYQTNGAVSLTAIAVSILKSESYRQVAGQKTWCTDYQHSAKMRNLHIVGQLEGIRRPELLPPLLPLVLVLHAVDVIVLVVVGPWGLRVVNALRSARVVGQHGDLAEVRDLHHDRLVVLGEGLLPRLAVDPHERVVGCAFVELEPDSMGLTVELRHSQSAIMNYSVADGQTAEVFHLC